ncbi:hypothetical protein [Nocardioides ochotonae]|uniref:hypothetical protein n=1 Tax=Nocardioides ochotonae TaxID=2685869 RepID=UPI001407CDCB|nr:hypothetical protein [Nocardioides ochotonae]
MDDEIQLISDGDGMAVIGPPSAVERFLAAEGLRSRELGMARLVNMAGSALETASVITESSGRWVKLTEESAAKVKKYGLLESKQAGVSHAMIGRPGEVKSWLQIAKAPGTVAANPAVLAGAAGIMTQLAMQQTIDEITDYLETIDRKLDDVLRAQKDNVVAQMVGVGLQIEEALTIRTHVGRVNEVTWSKVQDVSGTIAHTQAYALLQLDALAEKLENKTRLGDLVKAVKDAEATADEWLAVLARCFQLQDAIAVLELDRVFETAPEDLDGHRLGVRAARQERLTAIAASTERLVDRLGSAARMANAKVLFNPAQSPAVVRSGTQVMVAVADLHERLGIGEGQQSPEARRWREAASEVRAKALEVGGDRFDAARRRGGQTLDRARATQGRFSRGISERGLRRVGRGDEGESLPEEL